MTYAAAWATWAAEYAADAAWADEWAAYATEAAYAAAWAAAEAAAKELKNE